MREIVNKETEKTAVKRVEKKYFPHVFCCQAYDKKVRWTFFSYSTYLGDPKD